jgi:hypothetical protein
MAKKHKPKPRKKANPLYNPAAVLSGVGLKKAARQITNAQYAPKIGAAKAQQADVTRQGNALIGTADDLYRQMAERESSAVATQSAIQARIKQEVDDANAKSKQALDSAAAEAERAVGDNGGVDVGAKGRLAAEMAAQRGNQASQAASASTAAATTSGNYAGLLAGAGAARALHGGEVHGQLSNRAQSQRIQLAQQIADLKGQKGDGFVKNLTDLRQNQFENSATVAGLGLKQADLEAQTQNQKASQRLADARIKQADKASRRSARTTKRGQDVTARGQDLSHSDRQAALNKKNDPKSKPELAASKKTKLSIDNARSSIRQYRAQGLSGPKITKKARKAGIEPVVLNAARDLEYLGYVSGPNVAALRRAGVRIPKAWLRRPKRTVGSTANTAGNSLGGIFG